MGPVSKIGLQGCGDGFEMSCVSHDAPPALSSKVFMGKSVEHARDLLVTPLMGMTRLLARNEFRLQIAFL